MADSKKIMVTFGTKTEEREIIVPGIVKYGKSFLIRCSLTGDWKYCSEERLNKLQAKAGSLEAVGVSYRSRDGKKTEKAADVASAV